MQGVWCSNQCYMDEFLHLFTAADIKPIVKLHKSQDNFDGMFGSHHCTNTKKLVQRLGMEQLKGKQNSQLIVFEAICDYHKFFVMLLMGTWEHWMTTIHWTCLYSDTILRMENLNKLKESSMSSHFSLKMKIFIHFTFLLMEFIESVVICKGH